MLIVAMSVTKRGFTTPKLPRCFATTGPLSKGITREVQLYLLTSWYKYNIHAGIDKFVNGDATVDEDNLKEYLKGMLDKVKKVLEKKGVTDLSTVTLCLYATGGVRALKQPRRDALFEFLEKFVYDGEGEGGFKFGKPKKRIAGTDGVTDGADESMQAIDGAKEALFGWVAANYSQGHALSNYRKYVEIGGASAQIAFLVDDVKENEKAEEDQKAIDDKNTEVVSAKKELEDADGPDVTLTLLLKVAELEADAAEIRAERWSDPVNAAKRVALSIGEHDTRVAKVEEIGGKHVFLASFPLGVKIGYTAYLQALTENKVCVLVYCLSKKN